MEVAVVLTKLHLRKRSSCKKVTLLQARYQTPQKRQQPILVLVLKMQRDYMMLYTIILAMAMGLFAQRRMATLIVSIGSRKQQTLNPTLIPHLNGQVGQHIEV